MQEEELAACEQMCESLISPRPHLCLQVVSFTSVSLAWCSRSGSTSAVTVRQQRVNSGVTIVTAFTCRNSEDTSARDGSPATGVAAPGVVHVLVLLGDADR